MIGVDGYAGWDNEAEADLAGSDKHFQEDRSPAAGSTALPTVWHPSLEKHWHAVDEGGAELMRAAFGAPARQKPLRIAPAPILLGERPAERPQPPPRAIDQDPQARFQASLMLALIVLVVLLAATFTPPIR